MLRSERWTDGSAGRNMKTERKRKRMEGVEVQWGETNYTAIAAEVTNGIR